MATVAYLILLSLSPLPDYVDMINVYIQNIVTHVPEPVVTFDFQNLETGHSSSHIRYSIGEPRNYFLQRNWLVSK